MRQLSDPARGFGAARPQEPTVFGARRPGFPFPRLPQAAVERWLAWMAAQGIQRVVCLLPPRQLAAYDDLLGSYRRQFGPAAVCWAPIPDFHLADAATLTGRILPFLAEADRAGAKTVVHCAGGVGRTGHVLAAWLVVGRGLSNADAIATVRRGGRNAREARGDLDGLLDDCRRWAAEATPQ